MVRRDDEDGGQQHRQQGVARPQLVGDLPGRLAFIASLRTRGPWSVANVEHAW